MAGAVPGGLLPAGPEADVTVDPGLVSELRGLAERVAADSAALLLAGRTGHLEVSAKSTPTDVVTQRDRESEALLVESILRARPQDGVLGEEGGVREGRSGVRWVLDPLDGTVNYLYGLPMWAVSVAAEVDGVVVVGVVDAPALGERYVAALGQGAILRDAAGERPLTVSSVDRLDAALVATGFGYSAQRRAAQARVVAALLPDVRDIRRAGAAAVDLCWLAAGRYDAYYERGLNDWDLAAGGLVAREAGAVVAGLGGRPAGPELVVAANPALFPALESVLTDLDADTDAR